MARQTWESERQARIAKAMRSFEDEKLRFQSACRAVGAAFAREGWRIMVGVPEWDQWPQRDTVAPFVLEGANAYKPQSGQPRTPAVFYAPRDEIQVPMPLAAEPVKLPAPAAAGAASPAPPVVPAAPATSGTKVAPTVSAALVAAPAAAPSPANAGGAAPVQATPDTGYLSPDEVLRQLTEQYPNLDIRFQRVAQGSYKAKLIPNVTEVEAVVVIAGGEGTASIGYACYCLERPVVAVGGIGGAARDLLNDVLFSSYDRVRELAGLEDAELLALTTSWSGNGADAEARHAKSAGHIVSVTGKLVDAQALAGRKARALLGACLSIMVAVLVLWVVLFLNGFEIAARESAASKSAVAATRSPVVLPASAPAANASAVPQANAPTASAPVAGAVASAAVVADAASAHRAAESRTGSTAPNKVEPGLDGGVAAAVSLTAILFGLLYVAAAAGTGLRLLEGLQTHRLGRLSWQALLVELVVALDLAFGLALLYLVGSISFTGEVSLLGRSAGNFSTVAVSMSLLGLWAGYLLPLEKLRKALSKLGESAGT